MIQRLRQAIREQRYRISSHANEEMSEDDLSAEDIESIILTGQIARKFTRDPRGARYEVAGDTTDSRRAYLVNFRGKPCSISLLTCDRSSASQETYATTGSSS
ncbi:DUF4258 domain-containing protein [Candidatus Poribacteria bacterium]|nr:DUF4258 domain-containing protein [Candidatus Poribacteria bacterium]